MSAEKAESHKPVFGFEWRVWVSSWTGFRVGGFRERRTTIGVVPSAADAVAAVQKAEQIGL